MQEAPSSHLKKDQIFIICAQEDKDCIIALQKNLKARGMKVWSMYTDDGAYSTRMGDSHLQCAYEELEKSCAAVLLISEDSIKKGKETPSFIYQEIRNFYSIAESYPCFDMPLLPVCIGKDYFNKLPASWLPFGLNSFKINGKIEFVDSGSLSEASLNGVCNEISGKYFKCLNANYKYILERKHKLVALGNRLMQSNDTVVKTISEDIRQTDENDSDSLHAMHVVSNELNEYDCNAYSLMIISSNILGSPDENNMYDPEKRGVKYYYYCPQKYLEQVEEGYREKLENFIRRNYTALKYAENSMRAHYVVNEKINSYLQSIFGNNSKGNGHNGIKVNTFLDIFSVTVGEYKEKFIELAKGPNGDYVGDFYNDDAEEVFLPTPFYSWLFGRDVKFNSNVFEFIVKIVEFLQSTSVHNKAAVDKLADCKKKLNNLFYFHKFLSGNTADIPADVRFKAVAKKVIGSQNDQNNTLIKRWVIERGGSDEWEKQDVEKVVEQAMKNVKFIPIKETSDFVPCNSFAVYEHCDRSTGKRRKELVWYSTAHNLVETSETVSANDEQEMLVILNEKTTDDDIKVVRETLEYLKNIKAIDDFCGF